MNREAVYDDLKTMLEGLGIFTTVSRRLAFVEELDPAMFPCIYQNQVLESPGLTVMDGYVAMWFFDVDWYIYALQSDTDAPATTVLNPIVDAVLTVTASGVELGGVMCSFAVNGAMRTYEGILGDRAVAVLPIRITVPSN